MDDFGTGYHRWLTLARACRSSQLKIDQSFVRHLGVKQPTM